LLTFTLRLTQIAHKTAGWDKEKGVYQEKYASRPAEYRYAVFKKRFILLWEVQL